MQQETPSKPTYTLYYAPGAASFAVHWMLLHMGAPFELIKVDLTGGEQRSAKYLALNPDGRVPTLIVDGVPRFETAALLMLLAERHPEAGLAFGPGDPLRPPYLQTLFFLANTVQPAFRSWFYSHEPAGVAHSAEVQAFAHVYIERAWKRLDAQMSDGRRYLIGNGLSAADFLGTMLMRWSRNMPRTALQHDHLGAYIRRMWQVPSLQLVHEREGLTDWLVRD
jgi:glutathione S-transferase